MDDVIRRDVSVDWSDVGLADRIRFWIIEKAAGHRGVMLNCVLVHDDLGTSAGIDTEGRPHLVAHNEFWGFGECDHA